MSAFKHFTVNTRGRDLVAGDIHGCFTKLASALDAVGFNPENGDRLFSVGDLVDRGPESPLVLEWLEKPWFHAVQGNHENMAIRWGKPNCRMDLVCYAENGGAWNIGNTKDERRMFSDALEALPLAIEVETEHGPVGIVHADCPTGGWGDLRFLLEQHWGKLKNKDRRAVAEQIQWDRSRIEQGFQGGVAGVRAVICGHTPVSAPMALGNVIYIDTAAWFRGGEVENQFALIDLATLAAVKPEGVTA